MAPLKSEPEYRCHILSNVQKVEQFLTLELASDNKTLTHAQIKTTQLVTLSSNLPDLRGVICTRLCIFIRWNASLSYVIHTSFSLLVSRLIAVSHFYRALPARLLSGLWNYLTLLFINMYLHVSRSTRTAVVASTVIYFTIKGTHRSPIRRDVTGAKACNISTIYLRMRRVCTEVAYKYKANMRWSLHRTARGTRRENTEEGEGAENSRRVEARYVRVPSEHKGWGGNRRK